MFESDPFAEETISTGEKVMESISQERQKTWNSLLESTDMSKNSKKAWSLIRKLRGDPKAAPQQPKVTANQVAHQLLLNGKSGKGQKKTKLDSSKNSENPGCTRPFTMEELINAISSLKPGKAIGLDDIATEQIKYLDLRQRSGFYSCIITA